MNKQEFCCIDCGIFFDKDVLSGQKNIFCPKCGRDVLKECNPIKVNRYIMSEIKPYVFVKYVFIAKKRIV